MENNYCIYVHTNLINGKKYVGQTRHSSNLNRRWGTIGQGYKGNEYFWRAIQKYGWDNFTHEILEDSLSIEEANEREEYWIAYYNTINPDEGYNHQNGGLNHQWNEESKDKMRGENNPNFGKSVWNSGISAKEDDRILSGERHPRYGVPLTEEHKEKDRLAHLGENNVWFGKKHTEETIKKMRAASPKNIIVRCIELDMIFISLHEAERIIGIDHHCISKCCSGERKTAGGYHWEYVKNKEVA